MTNPTDANRPLRVFDKILQGGLGEGNIGVVAARHGTGKHAILTSIAIDHAMGGRQTLHVALGENVHDVRAYDDEVLHAMLDRLGVEDKPRVITGVERNKQIYTYLDGRFSPNRLRQTLEFLREHAQFQPHLIEVQGWPDFQTVDEAEFRALKNIAVEYSCEIWCSANTTRDDHPETEMPDYIRRLEDMISVFVALEAVGDRVMLRFVKTKDFEPPQNAHLEFDPQSMLLRWR